MRPETSRRREQIINQLYQEGSVRVEELCAFFGVSSVTIRNDLRYLERQGRLLRAYGGAMLNYRTLNRQAQLPGGIATSQSGSMIAWQAAQLIKKGQTIMLDAGPIVAQMTPWLRHCRDLRVMTNALDIACQLTAFDGVDVIVAGGHVRKHAYSLHGMSAEQQLNQYRFDWLFLSVDSLELSGGITTTHAEEASLKRAMCRSAKNVVAVLEASRFGRISYCQICPLSDIDYVITDNRIPARYQRALTEQGIQLKIAQTPTER